MCRGADCDIAGDGILLAVLHSRDRFGVFCFSGDCGGMEVFAEWEEEVGVFVWDGAGVGLCDERDVGA